MERLWREFHGCVNMSGHELRNWLLTETAEEGTFPATSDPGLPAPGRDVVNLLKKRIVDLTEADLNVMAEVVGQVRALLADPPPDGPADLGWRHALMNRGYDPLREPPERSAG